MVVPCYRVAGPVLEVLARGDGPLMLRDLAAAAGMSAAKAHRYLVSFQRLGLVQQDSISTRYELGPAALRVGLAALSRVDAVRMARERMPASTKIPGLLCYEELLAEGADAYVWPELDEPQVPQ